MKNKPYFKMLSIALAATMLLLIMPIASTVSAAPSKGSLPPINAVPGQKITQSGYIVEKYGMANMSGFVAFAVQVSSPGILDIEFPVTTGVFGWETRYNIYAYDSSAESYKFWGSTADGKPSVKYQCNKADTYYFYFDMAYPPSELEISVTQSPLDPSEEGYSIRVFASNAACAVPVGERLDLSFELYKDGKSIGDQHFYYSFSFSKEGVFSKVAEGPKYSPYEGAPDAKLAGLIAGFKAEQEGSAILTVTELDTKMSIKLILTASSKLDIIRFNEVPVLNEAANGDTNFLNEGGLSVDDFTYTKNKEGYYDVDFTVYNSLNMYGAVCVYEQNGKMVSTNLIDRHKENPENLYNMGEKLYNAAGFVINFFGDREMYNEYQYYKNSSVSKKTNISVRVPQDGYITITTDISSCPAAFLYNIANFAIGTVSTIISLGDVSTEVTEKTVEEIFSKLPETVLKKWTEKYLDLIVEEASYHEIADMLVNTNLWLSDNKINLGAL